MQNKNKKAISEMVSYVLLVIIAVAVATLVFVYLKYYVPNSEKPECPPDVGLIIENYSCFYGASKTNLTLTLNNKGLFAVDAVYIRLEKEERRIKQSVAAPYYFTSQNGLLPGTTFSPPTFDVKKIVTSAGNYVVEIQPAVFTEKIKEGYPQGKELAVCENAVITQRVVCL